MNVPDEIDLLQRFRDDAPGPSATAWACARSAIEAARAQENQAGRGLRPGQFSGPRPERIPRLRGGRRKIIAACAIAALVAGLLAIVLPGTSPLTKPLHTAWQPARPLPASSAGPSGRAGTWQLASYLVSAGWQENTAGPKPGYLTCSTARTCYVLGDNSSSASGPADMDSFYVSNDGAATWSVLPLPGGITFTSALSCGSTTSCAAGALYHGQPVFIATDDGGHSWTISPLPAGDGQIFKLSCLSPTTCRGLASATGQPISPGFAALRASVRLVATTDGGRRFTATRFPPGESMQDITCPTTGYCVAVGVYNKSVPEANPIRGLVMISRDGGGTWRPGTLPQGLGPGPFPQVTCLDTAHCWMIGSVHDDAYSVMAVSADGGATWAARHLPATVPDPQLFQFACPTAAICYAAGEDSIPQHIGNTYNAGSAVVAVTHDGGATWQRVSFPKPARVPGGMQGDSFMAIGGIQCPQVDACVALGVSDQGSKSTPVYTSNP